MRLQLGDHVSISTKRPRVKSAMALNRSIITLLLLAIQQDDIDASIFFSVALLTSILSAVAFLTCAAGRLGLEKAFKTT